MCNVMVLFFLLCFIYDVTICHLGISLIGFAAILVGCILQRELGAVVSMSEQVILKRKHRMVNTLYEIYDNKLTARMAFCGDLLTLVQIVFKQIFIYMC